MKKYSIVTVTHVVSEPGDGTRYDYLVHRDGPYDFTFSPAKSTFAFPQRLSWFDVKNIVQLEPNKEISELAEKLNCNPWTLIECIKTMTDMIGD